MITNTQLTELEITELLLSCEDCSCQEPMQPCEACPNNAWLRLEEFKNARKHHTSNYS